MFDQKFITAAINRSAENPTDRRNFLRAARLTGLGVGAAALVAGTAGMADASDATTASTDATAPSDAAILNFALNLEYLEAEFYLRATTGQGLPDNLTGGTGRRGGVSGGHTVPFKTPAIRQFAQEIAGDEKAHVTFLRSALGGAAVSRPAINIDDSFAAAAVAAGLIKKGQKFDVYASEQTFLLAAFVFEDVGVTAYKGAAPLINNKTYLDAAAGILAVEAYHAAVIRTTLYGLGLAAPTVNISDLRDTVDGRPDDDQPIILNGVANLVPADGNGIAFGRTTAQVLNIVYLTGHRARSGGFFPNGVNGSINVSGDNDRDGDD
ncbi:ferritin-like domain-containing protein [Paeniglutamicibacter antarcticus]|uniref:Ferritin-like domain-containing protein n=2 Tax=Arthrobacter terrae TaxID=2935737 RepID=A0A931CGD5_9MICC|nr:ferritin-like domain-containing protein [Arthrobacter terrae]